MDILTTRQPKWQIQSHQRHNTYLVCQALKTGQMGSGIHIYCSDIYAENSTHNFYRKTGLSTTSIRLLVPLVDSIFFLLPIADNRQQKGVFFSMIKTDTQKSVWLINNLQGSSLAFSLQPVGSSSSSPASLQHLSP